MVISRTLFLALAVVWVVIVINRLADLNVSTGEWIEITITGIALIVAFTVWARHSWYRPHIHYRLVFPDGDMTWPPPSAESQKYTRKLVSGTGTVEVRLAIRASESASFSRIDVRFVKRKWFRIRRPRAWLGLWRLIPVRFELWYWENEKDKTAVEITHLVENGKRQGKAVRTPDVTDNSAGGVRLFYAEPQQVLAYEFLWLTATVVAPKGWKGYIGFEAAMADGRKARSVRGAHFAYTRRINSQSTPNIANEERESTP